MLMMVVIYGSYLLDGFVSINGCGLREWKLVDRGLAVGVLLFETLLGFVMFQSAIMIWLHVRVLITYLFVINSYYMMTWFLLCIDIPWSGMRMYWKIGLLLPYGCVHNMLGFEGSIVIFVSFYLDD